MRRLLAGVRTGTVVGAALAALAALAASTIAGPTAAEAEAPTAPVAPGARMAAAVSGASPNPAPTRYRFLSAPDFMNADVADLRDFAGWRRMLQRRDVKPPNSWNRSYARLVSLIMDRFRAEHPDDVLVAGDLVNGHWGRDARRTGIFGPVATFEEQKRAVDRAARVYFRSYRRLFTVRGLDLRPAVGDHEYGDNPWGATTPHGALKRATMNTIRNRFNRIFLRPYGYPSRPSGPARRTAYATLLDPEVLLVTLDEFKRVRGDVIGRVDRLQLAWLDRVLTGANRRDTDWVIVQGHLPIVPHIRAVASSAICYRGGTSSALWRKLVKHRVDLYLNGEVHSNTAHHVDGVTQISHGGLLGTAQPRDAGNTSYLVGDITGGRLALRLMRFRTAYADPSARLWQTVRAGAPVVRKRVRGVPALLGSMTLTKDQELLDRSGWLAPYDGPVGCKSDG